jgi:hypothetical protein
MRAGRGETRIYRSRICPEMPTTLLCLGAIVYSYTIYRYMGGRGDTRIYRSRICPEMATALLCAIVNSYTILI